MIGRAPRGNPYQSHGLVPLKGEIHLHTRHSDGRDTPAAMLRACRDAGYAFAAITDHNTISGVEEARAAAADLGLLLIPGFELTTFQGHAVCLGVTALPEWRDLEARGMDAFVDAVHHQGGVFCISHPTRLGSPACSGCEWRWPIAAEQVDLWEVFSAPNPHYPHPELSQLFWQRLLVYGAHTAPVAAGDVHAVAAAAAPRAATYVYVATRSAHALLEGLRARQLYASTGPRLDVWLEADDGRVALAGGRVTARGDWRPYVECEPPGGLDVRLQAIVSGEPTPRLVPAGVPLPSGVRRVYAEAVAGSSVQALTAPISIE